jgi:TRAP-type mannitol/chloroaromatic compound transport system permease small subunit
MSATVHYLQRIQTICDQISDWFGRTMAWLTLLMVVTMFVTVLLRYALNIPTIAVSESIIYMHALIFMLGSAYTLKHQGHVRVDIFYQRFDSRRQAWIELVGGLLLLLPMMLYIFISSWDYVLFSWSRLEGSPEPGGLPGVFLLKSVILLFALLMLLQGISHMIQAGLRLKGFIPVTEDEQGVGI